MNYTFKSSRSIIYAVFDQFNIEGSEWESRAPEWITNAMLELLTPKSLKEITEEVTTIDYRFLLPCNLKLFLGLSYMGKRLIRSTKYTSIRLEETKQVGEYTITDDNWVYVDGLENETLNITYKVYPYTFDKELNRTMPLIPNDKYVEIALMWYCMRQLLYRGYKHPVVSFASNSPDINPGIAWTKFKSLAVKSISALDPDAMYRLSITNNSLLNFAEIDYNNQIK